MIEVIRQDLDAKLAGLKGEKINPGTISRISQVAKDVLGAHTEGYEPAIRVDVEMDGTAVNVSIYPLDEFTAKVMRRIYGEEEREIGHGSIDSVGEVGGLRGRGDGGVEEGPQDGFGVSADSVRESGKVEEAEGLGDGDGNTDSGDRG